MEEQELRNLLRAEGEELMEVACQPMDITEDLVQDIADGVESGGLDHLVNNLGTVANVFKTTGSNQDGCTPEMKHEGVKLLCIAMERMYMEITADDNFSKESLANLTRPTKHKFRKYMSTIFFLTNKCFAELERAMTAESHNVSIQMAAKDTGKKRSKRQVQHDADSQFYFWHSSRPKMLELLWKIIQPPMEGIWTGGGGNDGEGHSIFRCLTLALCTTIRNVAKNLRDTTDELDLMFDILGILASKHHEEKAIVTRLIPLLKGSSETGTIIAAGIDRMINHCQPGHDFNMVMYALNEAFDTYHSRFDKETGQERGFQTFLTQLCMSRPRAALKSLGVVVQFLESESHIIRNAVLCVAKELMGYAWAKFIQPPNENEMREDRPSHYDSNWLERRAKLLDEILLMHMKDSNSLVRSKAINLLAELVKAKRLTNPEAAKLMKHIKLRLLDKTVTTRKAAVGLVVDLVDFRPFMVQPLESFVEKQELHVGDIISSIVNDTADAGVALYFIIKEFHQCMRSHCYRIAPVMMEQFSAFPSSEEALKFLEKCLEEKLYWKACEVMYLCMRNYTADLEPLLVALRANNNACESHEDIYMFFFKSVYPDIFPQSLDSMELSELNYIASNEVEVNRGYLEYLQCSRNMHHELEKCIPSMKKLLELGTTTDKKEALLFYSTICTKGYVMTPGITASIINALAQLTAEEIPDFVEPFKSIFIGTSSGPVGTIKKLLELVDQLSDNLVESLSKMIGQMYESKCLTAESIKILWDAFSLSTGNWEAKDSRSAAYILSIIGRNEKNIIKSNLTQLIEVGLGPRGIEDYELAKATLQAILYGCRVEQEFVVPDIPVAGRGKKAKAAPKSKSTEGIKYPPSFQLFSSLVDLIETGLKIEGPDSMDVMYPKVAELATQIIYRMCTDPNEIVMRFLPGIHGLVFGSAAIPESPSDPADPFKLSEKLLFRYMSFGKALLGAHITYFEQTVSSEIKARKALLDKSKKKSKVTPRVRTTPRSSTGSNISMSSSTLNHSTASNQQDEMDVIIGNLGFDAESDHIKTYIGKLLDTGFFRQFRVHVFYLSSNNIFPAIKSQNLKVGIIQALGKLMLVCEASVMKSLQILIGIWNSDEPFSVKLEILRVSIRLTVKFPNQMEKMNDCFSAGLAHQDARIRTSCMDYIQYMAMSDLLKVREQLSDTAACLCDKNPELREMARDFINQIAEKDNQLQNAIPDIISRLSARQDISQENFQDIMKTLLTKIKKEKQVGGLIERIVGRFKGPVSVRVCQDTAFCLTQIQSTEKTLKILKDNIAGYADKLGDEKVWDSFLAVLNSFHKLKSDQKLQQKVEEWEQELIAHHEKCVEIMKAEKAAKRRSVKERIVDSETSSDDEAMENESDAAGQNEEDDNEAVETEGNENKESKSDAEEESEGTEDEEKESDAVAVVKNEGDKDVESETDEDVSMGKEGDEEESTENESDEDEAMESEGDENTSKNEDHEDEAMESEGDEDEPKEEEVQRRRSNRRRK